MTSKLLFHHVRWMPPCQLIKQALDLVELEPAIVPKFWSKFDIGDFIEGGYKTQIPKLELFTNGHKVSERIGTVSDDPVQELAAYRNGRTG